MDEPFYFLIVLPHALDADLHIAERLIFGGLVRELVGRAPWVVLHPDDITVSLFGDRVVTFGKNNIIHGYCHRVRGFL